MRMPLILAKGLEDSMKVFRAVCLCWLLAGCSAPISDNRIAYESAQRITHRERAEQGDKDAQYILGNSYCCGEGGFWDTGEAVTWWCKAAGQGHDGAKLRLAQMRVVCPPAKGDSTNQSPAALRRPDAPPSSEAR
jgi:hypothetical protein